MFSVTALAGAHCCVDCLWQQLAPSGLPCWSETLAMALKAQRYKGFASLSRQHMRENTGPHHSYSVHPVGSGKDSNPSTCITILHKSVVRHEALSHPAPGGVLAARLLGCVCESHPSVRLGTTALGLPGPCTGLLPTVRDSCRRLC